jgi:N-acyl-D-amino-acid deacylase
LSLGLIYPPSSYGEGEELVALAKVVAKHHGILSVHMRSESTQIMAAVDEMLAVAKQSGVHLQISHLKTNRQTPVGQEYGTFTKN